MWDACRLREPTKASSPLVSRKTSANPPGSHCYRACFTDQKVGSLAGHSPQPSGSDRKNGDSLTVSLCCLQAPYPPCCLPSKLPQSRGGNLLPPNMLGLFPRSLSTGKPSLSDSKKGQVLPLSCPSGPSALPDRNGEKVRTSSISGSPCP
jgi:hypothetical protein